MQVYHLLHIPTLCHAFCPLTVIALAQCWYVFNSFEFFGSFIVMDVEPSDLHWVGTAQSIGMSMS